MLYRKIVTVCSEIQTKHINTLCGQNVEFLNVKRGSVGRNISVGTATAYWLDGPEIESRWGARFSAPIQTPGGPTQPPVQWVPCLSRE